MQLSSPTISSSNLQTHRFPNGSNSGFGEKMALMKPESWESVGDQQCKIPLYGLKHNIKYTD